MYNNILSTKSLPNTVKDKNCLLRIIVIMGHESGISLFASGNLFEQSYNPKVIHTYREDQQATRVVGFAKGNPLSRESLKTLKQHIPAAHLPHRGKSFDVCTELVERRLSKREKESERGKMKKGKTRNSNSRGVGLRHRGSSLFGKKLWCLHDVRRYALFPIRRDCINRMQKHHAVVCKSKNVKASYSLSDVDINSMKIVIIYRCRVIFKYVYKRNRTIFIRFAIINCLRLDKHKNTISK